MEAFKDIRKHLIALIKESRVCESLVKNAHWSASLERHLASISIMSSTSFFWRVVISDRPCKVTKCSVLEQTVSLNKRSQVNYKLHLRHIAYKDTWFKCRSNITIHVMEYRFSLLAHRVIITKWDSHRILYITALSLYNFLFACPLLLSSINDLVEICCLGHMYQEYWCFE